MRKDPASSARCGRRHCPQLAQQRTGGCGDAKGGSLAKSAKYFATSSRTLESVYFEHSLLEQDEDAEIMRGGGRRRSRLKMTQNTAM